MAGPAATNNCSHPEGEVLATPRALTYVVRFAKSGGGTGVLPNQLALEERLIAS
jgi:hypothetical protein